VGVRVGAAMVGGAEAWDTAEAREVPPGYKRTEVGMLPEDWMIGPVYSLAGESNSRFDDGDWVEAEFLETSGVRLLQTGNIGVGEFIDKVAKKYISDASFDRLGCKGVEPGDLLICRLADPVGRACIVPELADSRLITAVDVTIFRPLPHVADTNYLLQVFCTQRWLSQVADRCGGSTRSRIARGQLAKIKVPLPPLPEQRAIAEALGDVDGLLGGLDALLAKKHAIKQAAMQQLLTGKTRLPGFSGERKTVRLGEHAEFLRTGSNSRAELTVTGSVQYLHYGDIHTSAQVHIEPRTAIMPCLPFGLARTLNRLREGDVVFVDASEDLDGVGKSVEIGSVAQAEVVAGLHTIAVRFDNSVLANGFKAYLQFCPQFREHLRRLAAGTKVYATNRSHIASAEIRLPGVREQTAIAAVLSDMDAEIEALEHRRDKTRAIKQGMMQQLLTGRVRLVRQDTITA
jgi:type I restriction enzyme S subunit